MGFVEANAANNGRLVIVNFVKKWRSHAQKAQAQGCPESVANDVAWPCYTYLPLTSTVAVMFDELIIVCWSALFIKGALQGLSIFCTCKLRAFEYFTM